MSSENDIFNVEKYELGYNNNTSKYEYHSCVFTNDGEKYIGSCGDNTYRIIDIDNSIEESVVESPLYGTGIIDHTHNSDVILSTFDTKGYLNAVGIVSLKTSEILRIFYGHSDDIISLHQNNMSDTFVTSGYDNRVILWDPRSNNPTTSILDTPNPSVSCFSANGLSILAVYKHNIAFFELKTFPLVCIVFYNLRKLTDDRIL